MALTRYGGKRSRQGRILDIADKIERVYNVGSNLYGRWRSYNKGSQAVSIPRNRMRMSYRRKKCCKETKWLDLSIAGVDLTYDVVLFKYLNIMVLGDDIGEREGRLIECTSIQIRGYVSGVAAMTNDPTLFRIMLVWDFWPNATAFTPDLVLNDTGTPFVVTSLRNRDISSQKRFKVLKDWRSSIGILANASSNKRKMINWYVDLKKATGGKTRWDAAGGAETDIQQGKLILMGFSETANAGTTPNLTARCRLNYVDP